MSNLELHQLTYPELLSEEILREILENKCIKVPKFKALSKSELVEIYMRVALPLPQRQFEGTRCLGKRIQHLRTTKNIKTAINEKSVELEVNKVYQLKAELSNQSNGIIRTLQAGKSKRPIDEANLSSKRMCLSNVSEVITTSRSSEDTGKISTATKATKRQKITWP